MDRDQPRPAVPTPLDRRVGSGRRWRGDLGVHPGDPQGADGCPRGDHDDHAQCHRPTGDAGPPPQPDPSGAWRHDTDQLDGRHRSGAARLAGVAQDPCALGPDRGSRCGGLHELADVPDDTRFRVSGCGPQSAGGGLRRDARGPDGRPGDDGLWRPRRSGRSRRGAGHHEVPVTRDQPRLRVHGHRAGIARRDAARRRSRRRAPVRRTPGRRSGHGLGDRGADRPARVHLGPRHHVRGRPQARERDLPPPCGRSSRSRSSAHERGALLADRRTVAQRADRAPQWPVSSLRLRGLGSARS